MPTTTTIPNVFELLHLNVDAPEGRDIRFGATKPTRLDQLTRVADFFSLPQTIPGDANDIEPALEYVFSITQNVDRSWVEAVSADDADSDLAVFAPDRSPYYLIDKPLRSTSVGDVIYYPKTDTYYLVAGHGFEKIELA